MVKSLSSQIDPNQQTPVRRYLKILVQTASHQLSGSELRLKMCRLHCTSHIPQCLRLRVKCYQDDNLFHQRFTFYGRALLLFYGFTFKFEGSKNYIGFVGSLLDKVYVYRVFLKTQRQLFNGFPKMLIPAASKLPTFSFEILFRFER